MSQISSIKPSSLPSSATPAARSTTPVTAPAIAKDSLATSTPAKAQDDKGGHGWKIFGIAGIAIGGLSLAALGTAAVFAFKGLLAFGETIG